LDRTLLHFPCFSSCPNLTRCLNTSATLTPLSTYIQHTSRPSAQVAIVDDSGAPLPPDSTAVGEVVCRGPTLFGGYSGAAAAANTGSGGSDGADSTWLQPGGWFRTGDLAAWRGGGYLSVVDRKKDMVR
jgi:acyl-CoA synthetase (AMP-forming)/AMP-acid ligase II